MNWQTVYILISSSASDLDLHCSIGPFGDLRHLGGGGFTWLHFAFFCIGDKMSEFLFALLFFPRNHLRKPMYFLLAKTMFQKGAIIIRTVVFPGSV